MRDRIITLKYNPWELHTHYDVVESQGELLGTVAYPGQPDKVSLFTKALKRIRGAKQRYSPNSRLPSLKQAEDIVSRGMEVITRDRFSAADAVLNTHLSWWDESHKVSLSEYVREKTERLNKVEKSLRDDGLRHKGQYRFDMTPHYFFKEIWTPSKPVLSLSCALRELVLTGVVRSLDKTPTVEHEACDEGKGEFDHVSDPIDLVNTVSWIPRAVESAEKYHVLLSACTIGSKNSPNDTNRLEIEPSQLYRFVPDPLPKPALTYELLGAKVTCFSDLYE